MTSLFELTRALGALLPVPVTGYARNQVYMLVGPTPHLTLPCLPLVCSVAVLTIYGVTIAATDYTVNYGTGVISFPTLVIGDQVIISYQFDLTDELIRQAVNDLGRRLPRRAVMQTIMRDGIAPLPLDLQTLISATEILADCCQAPCAACEGGCNCEACGIFVSGAQLVMNPAPCEEKHFALCYTGGYPLDERCCFDGLTPELADLVLLKAQALAYSSPKVLLELSGQTVGNGSSSQRDERVKIVVEETDRCERNKTTTTTETGSGTGNKTSSFLGSTSYGALAQLYQKQYDDALLTKTEITVLGKSCNNRSRYRTRLGY